MMRVPAKLIGGRYDGDTGTMRVEQVPEYIWAFDCPGGDACTEGGVHWATNERSAREHAATELYAHTGFDGTHGEMPIAVYVAAPDHVPLDGLYGHELANA